MVLLNFAVCNKRVFFQTDIRFNSSFMASGTRQAANFCKRSNRIDRSTTLVRLIDVTG